MYGKVEDGVPRDHNFPVSIKVLSLWRIVLPQRPMVKVEKALMSLALAN